MPSGWTYRHTNRLAYAYTVDGVDYVGHTYSNAPFVALDTEKIRKGATITVFHHPLDHNLSLIHIRIDWARVDALWPGLVLLAVLFGVVHYGVLAPVGGLKGLYRWP